MCVVSGGTPTATALFIASICGSVGTGTRCRPAPR
jgi:hypothetical protein